eukprot:scaffold2004_cov101-Cylindrotheca_fusiformis.AAC.3
MECTVRRSFERVGRPTFLSFIHVSPKQEFALSPLNSYFDSTYTLLVLSFDTMSNEVAEVEAEAKVVVITNAVHDETTTKTTNNTVDELREKLSQLRSKRRRWKEVAAEVNAQKDRTVEQLDVLHRERQQSLDELDSILQHRHSIRNFLEISERWNVMNDCFHIWHQGPFATINNCRLGAEAPVIPSMLMTSADEAIENRQNNNIYTGKHSKAAAATSQQQKQQHQQAPTTTPPRSTWSFFSSPQVANDTTSTTTSIVGSTQSPPRPSAAAAAAAEAPKVPWPEVNAALGHVVLLIQLLSTRAKIKLPHTLHCMGATSKIAISHGTIYNVYFEESSLIWGRSNLRNFHIALSAVCECIVALSRAQTDKTIAIPHTMEKDSSNNNTSWKIGGMPLVHGYGGTSGVEFTSACKYLLTNLKWIVAYSVKHHAPR